MIKRFPDGAPLFLTQTRSLLSGFAFRSAARAKRVAILLKTPSWCGSHRFEVPAMGSSALAIDVAVSTASLNVRQRRAFAARLIGAVSIAWSIGAPLRSERLPPKVISPVVTSSQAHRYIIQQLDRRPSFFCQRQRDAWPCSHARQPAKW